jgi:hypothetical protein
MSSTAIKHLFALLFITALIPLQSIGQDLTGIWRGRFVTITGEEYRFELQIEQSKTNRISGVSYSYLDTRFYGKATLSGSYTKSTKSALIQEIKTVEVKMAGGSTACIMKCQFVYSKSGKEEFLEGTYTSAFEKSEPLSAIKKGDDCGGGKVYLRKVSTSDFYIEPFLRNKNQPKKTDTAAKKPPVVNPKPQTQKTTTTTKPVVKQPVKTTVPSAPKRDSVKQQATIPVNAHSTEVKPKFTIPATTRSRENALTQTVNVSSEEIQVRLYDNGEIDGDTISVYLDGKAIVSNKGLSTSPITLNLKMDENNPDHVLVMVAENLGRIPPNTSLMLVQDGDKRYQVSITSTEQKNAMVRFRYQKK